MSPRVLTDQNEEDLKILSTISEPVEDIDSIQDLIKNLKNFLLENAETTVGISAPQFGENKMVFAMANTHKANDVTVCINPEILKVYDKKINFYSESCLSVPERKILTRRYSLLKVAYLDETGKRLKRTLKDTQAVIFQHELDHLFGMLMINRHVNNESEDIR